jgi:hypothetical protein
MRRQFAVLAVLGALAALALPASSMASMYPAGHKFEIVGNVNGPKLTTSLGSCPLTKITGQIPAAPQNESANPFVVSTPTVGTCTSGTSLSLSGEWKLIASGYTTMLTSTSPEAVTMRFSSLPGCKLTGTAALLGIWSNGATVPYSMNSGYHAHRGFPLTWANDGGTCALAGKQEAVSYQNELVSGSISTGAVSSVADLTSPGTPIIVGLSK